MYILTLKDKPEGVFSVLDDFGDHIIPLFENEDDAERYYLMIEDIPDYPEMQVYEIEADVILGACEDRDQKYAIITGDTLLIPPEDLT
jgi:hypothetical protein